MWLKLLIYRSGYTPKRVYAVERGAYIPSEDSAEEESELPVDELNEESSLWEKFKSWEGWPEIWKRVKDVAGATLPNVLGGRILERLNSDSSIPGTIFIRRGSRMRATLSGMIDHITSISFNTW